MRSHVYGSFSVELVFYKASSGDEGTAAYNSYTRPIISKSGVFDIYFNFAVHFLCVALITGVAEYKLLSLYFPVLMITCICLAFYSARVRKFLYMLYAVIYGYVGLSIVVVDWIHRETLLIFAYFIATSGLVIYFIFKMSRQSREEQ